MDGVLKAYELTEEPIKLILTVQRRRLHINPLNSGQKQRAASVYFFDVKATRSHIKDYDRGDHPHQGVTPAFQRSTVFR